MNINNRKLLKLQLEQQAQRIYSETNDATLSLSILTTCNALLRAVEKSMPKTFSQQEFDNVFSGYLGITGRINGFYNSHSSFFNDKESTQLQQILKDLKESEQKKKELDDKTVSEKRKCDALKANIKVAENTLSSTIKQRKMLEEKEAELEAKRQETENRISALNKELSEIKNNINALEPTIEGLINSVLEAQETYDELVAYYPELTRIEAGVKEDGFVNIESFTNKLQSMNNDGKILMEKYDSLLHNLTEDVETLQAKLEARRKAGNLR